MKGQTTQLPVVSLLVAGASSLACLAVNSFPSDSRRGVVFVVCVSALASLVLGIAGLVATRGGTIDRRIPAGVGIVLGGVVFLWSGLVFWLSTPF